MVSTNRDSTTSVSASTTRRSVPAAARYETRSKREECRAPSRCTPARESHARISTGLSPHTRRRARQRAELGPLVLVGPVRLGQRRQRRRRGAGIGVAFHVEGPLPRREVVAYVPRAEGWGLPPVEALHEGARVVASVTTPSVADNSRSDSRRSPRRRRQSPRDSPRRCHARERRRRARAAS